MKKPFQWNWNQYVYSFERLIKLIDDDKSRAVFPKNKQSGEMETSSIKVRDFFQRIDENIDDPTIQQILEKSFKTILVLHHLILIQQP